jgi:tetratricopeptide (TPR) repeat protein
MMIEEKHGNASWFRAKADEARQHGDPGHLSLALSDLGVALFKERQFEEGMEALGEAVAIAAETGDVRLQVQRLAAKASALEDIGRYHNAYEAMSEVLQLAQAREDASMTCAALTAQGQILIRSGAPQQAEEVLQQARELAAKLEDQSHLMKVMGTLGNLKIALNALDDAHTFFEMAVRLASQLNDKRAESGYLLNQGAVLSWQQQHAAAAPIFQRTLVLAAKLHNRQLELTSLRYLTECYHHTAAPERIPELAQRGIALAMEQDEGDVVFSFFQTMILAYYRMNQQDAAGSAIQEAVDYARSVGDLNREVDMLLNLGEACVVAELYDQALSAYTSALEGAGRLDRVSDQAYLIGRIGVVLAELGRIEEAATHHKRAAKLARKQSLPELEGEQLIMLALAALEQRDREQALAHCQAAIEIYASAQLTEQEAHARKLLAEITSQ